MNFTKYKATKNEQGHTQLSTEGRGHSISNQTEMTQKQYFLHESLPKIHFPPLAMEHLCPLMV